MNKLLTVTVLLATSTLFFGCATVFSGTSQSVTIDSNIKGATITIDGNVVGVTPFVGKIPRKRESSAMISKEGYNTMPLNLTSSFNMVSIANILGSYFSTSSSTTDAVSGAMWEYSPRSFYVNLMPVGASQNGFRLESTLKAFTMTYFSDIQKDLAANGGEKIDAIYDQFFKSQISRSEFNSLVSRLASKSSGNPVDFAESVHAACLGLN